MRVYHFILLAILLAACSKSPEQKGTSSHVDHRIDSVLRLMTLEEKIGQLNLPSAGAFTTGQAENSDIAKK